jgi:hypothetical protein
MTNISRAKYDGQVRSKREKRERISVQAPAKRITALALGFIKEQIMHISRLAMFIIAATLLAGVATYAQDREISTIADKNGCKVYNPMPQEKESIRWDGRCSEGFADGKGILDWYIGDQLEERYEGDLKQGWAEGQGTYTSRRGMRYEGNWKKSMQDGTGTMQTPDGSIYQGEWKEGKPNGWGVYRTPDGESVEGEWVDGELKSEAGSRRI